MTSDDRPTVLVVDDESDIADTYSIWLEEEYEVRTAYSGREALGKLDEAVDVVLLDRRMPQLSGDEVLARIRERDLSCRVAMVTAVEPEFDIVDMGFDAYLTKPVFGDDLHETISRLLARAGYDASLQRYFALSEKRVVLEAEKGADELDQSDEYDRLCAELDRLRDELDEAVSDFEPEDYSAAFRDLGRDEEDG